MEKEEEENKLASENVEGTRDERKDTTRATRTHRTNGKDKGKRNNTKERKTSIREER